jgi:hypothetical protein
LVNGFKSTGDFEPIIVCLVFVQFVFILGMKISYYHCWDFYSWFFFKLYSL